MERSAGTRQAVCSMKFLRVGFLLFFVPVVVGVAVTAVRSVICGWVRSWIELASLCPIHAPVCEFRSHFRPTLRFGLSGYSFLPSVDFCSFTRRVLCGYMNFEAEVLLCCGSLRFPSTRSSGRLQRFYLCQLTMLFHAFLEHLRLGRISASYYFALGYWSSNSCVCSAV